MIHPSSSALTLTLTLTHPHPVFYPGFFGMLDLSFRAWDPDETYGGWYWTQMMSFYQKNFAIGVCEKNIFFFGPWEIFFLFSSIPFFRI